MNIKVTNGLNLKIITPSLEVSPTEFIMSELGRNAFLSGYVLSSSALYLFNMYVFDVAFNNLYSIYQTSVQLNSC